MRAVIKDNWKYITAIKWVPPGERPEALKKTGKPQKKKKSRLNIWGPVVHEELYNLSKDPKEKNNLQDKEKRREFREIIQKYRIYCRQRGLKSAPGADKKSPISEKDKKKLKSLGYLRP